MLPDYGSELGSGGGKGAYIKTLFHRPFSCQFLRRLGCKFHNRHVTSPFFLVCNQIQAVVNTVCARLYPPGFKVGSLRDNPQRFCIPEFVLHAVAEGGLVCLEFYHKVPFLSPDCIDYIFLHRHGIGRDYLSRQVQPFQ